MGQVPQPNRRSIRHSVGVSSDGDPFNAWLCAGTGRLRFPAPVSRIETVGVWGPRTAGLPLNPPQAPMALFAAAVVTATNLVKHGLYLTIDRTESFLAGAPQGRCRRPHRLRSFSGPAFTELRTRIWRTRSIAHARTLERKGVSSLDGRLRPSWDQGDWERVSLPPIQRTCDYGTSSCGCTDQNRQQGLARVGPCQRRRRCSPEGKAGVHPAARSPWGSTRQCTTPRAGLSSYGQDAVYERFLIRRKPRRLRSAPLACRR